VSVSRLTEGAWLEVAIHDGDERVRLDPFPEAPLDLNDIHVYGTVDAGGRPIFGMPWEMELVPHSGVWVPDPSYGKAR